jgi:signal transduction histidine kinase
MTRSLRELLRALARQRSAAAVGEFATSLAHEVRNPLTAVRLDLEDVRDQLADPSTTALLDHALAQVDRLDATVRGTLRLAASGALDLEPIDLNAPVRAALHAAQPAAVERGVTIQDALRDDPIPVRGNAAAIEQLVLNLLLNGVEAVGDGGHVSVSTEGADGTAVVAVMDDGPGISPVDLARVEEPFFTTKPEGTGLGLALVRRGRAPSRVGLRRNTGHVRAPGDRGEVTECEPRAFRAWAVAWIRIVTIGRQWHEC